MAFSVLMQVLDIKNIKNLKQCMRGTAEDHEAPMKRVLPAKGCNSAHQPQGPWLHSVLQ